MERICEPELMDDPHQAQAYAEADFSSSDAAFTQEVLARLMTRRPRGAEGERIVDLGCGPGNITFRLAEALPKAHVLGLDGAEAMLRLAMARRQCDPGRWARLHFEQGTLPLAASALHGLPEGFGPPFTALVSNSLLHHLHDPAVLWHTVRQLAAPGALVMVRDLRRPPDARALQALVERHGADAPPSLRRDYANSLAAAFLPVEVERQLMAAGLHQLDVAPVGDRYLEVSGWLP